MVNTGTDMELLATPTRNPSQPRLLWLAPAVPAAALKLSFEPGWSLKRRAYGEKTLGHIYVYRDGVSAE